ncbi:hypothetical protein FRC09_013161 [Ceratobasidium sp. 395]|nr:hypothetical protein FRC09_013161 [Ceratobasidium sp. 395]
MHPPPPSEKERYLLFVAPRYDVALEDVVANKHLPPLSLQDFEDYLQYVEGTPQNLHFHQWLERYHTLHEAWVSTVLPTIPSTSTGGYRPRDLWERLNPCQDWVLKEEFAYAKARWFYESASARLDVTEEMRRTVLAIPNLPPPPETYQNELTQKLPSFPNQPTPSHFDAIRERITSHLRTALTRFLRLAFCNSGLWHTCASHMGATVMFLAPGLALWILGIYSGRRGLVGRSLPLIWAGFWIMLMCTNGHCFAMWLTGDARQLYPARTYDRVAPPLYEPRRCPKAPGTLSPMDEIVSGARTRRRRSGGSRMLDLSWRRDQSAGMEGDLESGMAIELDTRGTIEQPRMDLKLQLPAARKTKDLSRQSFGPSTLSPSPSLYLNEEPRLTAASTADLADFQTFSEEEDFGIVVSEAYEGDLDYPFPSHNHRPLQPTRTCLVNEQEGSPPRSAGLEPPAPVRIQPLPDPKKAPPVPARRRRGLPNIFSFGSPPATPTPSFLAPPKPSESPVSPALDWVLAQSRPLSPSKQQDPAGDDYHHYGGATNLFVGDPLDIVARTNYRGHRMFETEDIDLAPINVAQGKPPDLNQLPPATQGLITQTSTLAPRVPAFQRLAKETTGRELAPEASIWQLYVEEAKEHDGELLESENKNLDLMLLFAALFSAILTAFIIESKNLLQQDPADVSVALLLAIAQSQQRVEQGIPEILPLIEIPKFSSSMAFRWINGLWYTALALSLAAALVALLAKEWLTAFMASRPRPPHAYALVHHRRLQGLKEWGALHMIDLLPSMLHLSLLLFSLGMAVYLWTIDLGIAIMIVIITGSTMIFYTGTAVLGAMYESCPFVTQVSRYLRALLDVTPWAQRDTTSTSGSVPAAAGGTTTHEELHALRWLAETARDPEVVDYVCQALVGVRPAVSSASPTKQTEANDASGTTWTKTVDAIKRMCLNLVDKRDPSATWRDDLVYLHDTLCTRISDAQVLLQKEQLDSRGANMANFLNATSTVILCLKPGSSTKAEHMTTTPDLSALDCIWSHTCPQLMPDVYTAFVAAELRMVVSIALSECPESTALAYTTGTQVTENQTSTVIQILEESKPSNLPSLFEVRSRYTQGLVRAGLLIKYHCVRGVIISTQRLVDLLESIRLAALCKELNLDSYMSTCHPQSQNNPGVLPVFQISVTSGGGHCMDPLNMGDEDMAVAGLVRLVASAAINNSQSLELAAGRALHAVFPRILQQWIRMVAELPEVGLAPDSEKTRFVQGALDTWPSNLVEVDRSENLADWTLRQLTIVAAVSVSLADRGRSYMSYLPGIALKALHDRASLHTSFKSNNQDFFILSRMIDYACSNINYIDPIPDDNSEYSESPIKLTLRLLGVRHSDGHLFARYCLGSSLPSVFNLISRTIYDIAETKKILGFIESEVQEELPSRLSWSRGYYLYAFAVDSRCFAGLVALRLREEYAPPVLECVDGIISSIHQAITNGNYQRTARRMTTSSSIPDAVLFVVRQTMDTNRDQLQVFVSKVVEIFTNLDWEAQQTLRQQPAIDSICEELTVVAEAHEEMKELTNSFINWVNIYEGVAQLFDGSNDHGPETPNTKVSIFYELAT